MRRYALLPLLLTACPELDSTDCTSMGCVDGVEVYFTGASHGSGVYTVDIDLHGEQIHCQATIPLETDDSDGCDDSRVSLFLSGSELDPSEQSVDGFFLDSTEPSAMAVTVSFDEGQIGYSAFDIGYEELQPNGPGCEPTCRYATRDIALD